jgi:hypothetical protein
MFGQTLSSLTLTKPKMQGKKETEGVQAIQSRRIFQMAQAKNACKRFWAAFTISLH